MRFISAVALLLVAVSLGALYSVQPAPMILALIPLLLGGGVAVVFFGGKQGAVLLAAIALSLSIAAASAIGMERWGATGALILPIVWLALLFLGVVWAWNSTIWVSGGTVVLIQHPGGARKHYGPARIWPALPIFESHYATLPLYQMIQHVHVNDINTRSLWNLKGLEMEIHYRVRDPDKAFSGLPNRSRVFRAAAGEMNVPLHKALLMPVFWEQVLGARVREEAEDVLRQIVYQTFNYATEISLERARLAGEMQEHLAEAARNWGLEIIAIEMGKVELEEVQIRKAKREFYIKRELEDAERHARMEAQKIEMTGKAHAEVQAHTIASWIQAIQEQGLNLSADDIERIIFNVVEERNRQHRRKEMVDKMIELGGDTRTTKNGHH